MSGVFSNYKGTKEIDEMQEVVESKRKLDLRVRPHGRYGLWIIEWASGGATLPESLKGRYTSKNNAMKAVNKYIAEQKPDYNYRQKEKQEKQNAKDAEIQKQKQDEEAKEKQGKILDNFFKTGDNKEEEVDSQE